MIKNIIFDFDNTLEDWNFAEKIALDKLSDYFISSDFFSSQKKISKKVFIRAYQKAKQDIVTSTTNPKEYKREVWFSNLLNHLGYEFKKSHLKQLTNIYWKYIDGNVKLFSDVLDVLKSLYPQFQLFIYSDSDGAKYIKMRRIKKLRISRYFQGIYTSDDTKYNKPNVNGIKWILNIEKINAKETMFVGDHPQTDLYGSKKLGMKTVWIKKGFWSNNNKHFSYVDYEINNLSEILDLLIKN